MSKFFALFAAFTLLFFYCSGQGFDFELKKKVEWIKENAIEINSISDSDTLYDDLNKLATVIGDTRFLFLGEQSHGDGSAFQAKVRLIKYLHEKLGFNVIAFESDYYSAERLDDSLSIISKANVFDLKIFEQNIYQIWSLSEQVKPLFGYVLKSKNTNKPIKLTGFDCSHPQAFYNSHFIKEFLSFLYRSEYNLNNPNFEKFVSVLKNLIKLEYLDHASDSEQSLYFNHLTEIQNYFTKKENLNIKGREEFEHLLSNLEGLGKTSWSLNFDNGEAVLLDKYGNKFGNVRDEFLAKNILWLTKKYQKEKIIFWGASYHFSKNLRKTDSTKTGVSYENTITAADIVNKILKDKSYSIGFTSYDGFFGMPWQLAPTKISKPSTGSLEFVFDKCNINMAFIDLRKSSKKNWLKNEFAMKPLGYKEMTANWSEMLDGIFFIKTMMPSSTIPKFNTED